MGATMRPEIRENYRTYVERFEAGGASLPVVLEQSDAWAAFIARDNPEYADEMAGIAAGADLSLTEVAMLNARYELTYCVFGSEAQTLNKPAAIEQEGCTSFGLLPEMTASGHTMIGQNWDWLQKRTRSRLRHARQAFFGAGERQTGLRGFHRSRHRRLQNGCECRGHRLMRQRPGDSAGRGQWIPQAIPCALPRNPGCLDIRQGSAAGGANGSLLFDQFPDRARRGRNH